MSIKMLRLKICPVEVRQRKALCEANITSQFYMYIPYKITVLRLTSAGMVRERTSYDLYDKDCVTAMTSQASAAAPPPQRQHKSSEGSADSGGYRSSDTLHAGGRSLCHVTSVYACYSLSMAVHGAFTITLLFVRFRFRRS